MKVYTDGSFKDEVGGWAWWCPENKTYQKGAEHPSSNQRMELYAALEAINTFFDEEELTIVSDSKYLVNCFGELWWVRWLENGWIGSNNRGVSNRDIWEPLLELVQKHGNVSFEWVKGHSGDPDNDKADEIANGAVIERLKELQVEEERNKAILEKPIVIGELRCSYCREEATTHWLLYKTKKFLATCEMHTRTLRMPLILTEMFDEHPWGLECNVEFSEWCISYDPEQPSHCVGAH